MESASAFSSHMDVLKEVSTIGSGRASAALAEMINVPVEISVPETKLIPAVQFAKIVARPQDTNYVLVIMLSGQISGKVFFVVSPEEARILGAALLNVEESAVNLDEPLVQSALKEALNIMAGAYMTILSDFTGCKIIFSIPYMALDILTAVFIAEQSPGGSSEMIFIKNALKIRGRDFNGVFLFFPDLESIAKIFNSLSADSLRRYEAKA